MPHNLAAVETAKYLVLSSSGTAFAVGLSLAEQLSVTHNYLNLELPYWVFLVSMIILNFVGAYFATSTDYMKNNGSKLGNFSTASSVGFILSFVVIPTISTDASVGLMQIAAFISGLCGTILLRVIINIMNRQDLQDSIIDLIVTQSIKFTDMAIKLISDNFIKILTAMLITLISSYTLLPEVNKVIQQNNNSQQEVQND